MRIKTVAKQLVASVVLSSTIFTAGAIATAKSAEAAPTYCKTLHLRGQALGFAVHPRMDVPICYNGRSVWRNGNVTPGVTTVGYYLNGITWYGTYGSGGWIGAGENFSVSSWGNAVTLTCAPRPLSPNKYIIYKDMVNKICL